MGSIPKIRFGILILGCLTFILAESVQASSLGEVREDRKRLVLRVQTQEKELAVVQSSLEEVSKKIHELKTTQKKRKSLLGGYELRGHLQEAQELSSKVEGIREDLQMVRTLLHEKSIKLAAKIENEINKQRRARNNSAFASVRRKLARVIAHLDDERNHLLGSTPQEPLPSEAKTLLENGDNERERAERLLAIRDFERKLKTEAESLERSLAEYKRQRFIRSEIGYLLDEEAFFAERGFIRGRTRTEGETDTTLSRTQAKTRKDITDEPSDEVGATNPTTEAGETEALPAGEMPADEMPAEEPSTPVDGEVVDILDSENMEIADDASPEGVDTSETIEASTVELALISPEIESVSPGDIHELIERDSLARLATDMGLVDETISHKMNQELLGKNKKSGVTWLRMKLKLTRQLLEILRNKANELETKLAR